MNRWSPGRGDSNSKGLEAWSEAGRMAGLGKGSGPHFLFFPPPSSEVAHVMMEGTISRGGRLPAGAQDGGPSPRMHPPSALRRKLVHGEHGGRAACPCGVPAPPGGEPGEG